MALVVDDEPDLLSLLSISLDRMGVDCQKAESVGDAIDALGTREFDFCLTDLKLPDGTGLDIVHHIRIEAPTTPVAIITAFGDTKTAVTALKSGAFDYVSKPLDLKELDAMVSTALKLRAPGSNDSAPVSTPETSQDRASQKILGDSRAMEKIRTMVRKVARTQAPVHIYGETGTGKELIARMIHDQGPRADQPFVAVNCGAIPRELMESEFFGHKKGSFTGAVQDTEGLFRTAGGGTLFLDEVGELPKDLQVKLLRAIQEKRVRPVGESREVPIDVRIISATHRNLAKLVDTGEFRQDFFYRINVIPIHAPPLRARPEDIRILAEHFATGMTGPDGEHVSINDDAIRLLQGYAFPGNVRELENIIERAIAMSEASEIDADDLMLPETMSQDSVLTEGAESLPIDEHTRRVEIERIRLALAETDGNITAAAKVLGTSFRSLRYRIKKLGIAE